jgi:hypothetical protein
MGNILFEKGIYLRAADTFASASKSSPEISDTNRFVAKWEDAIGLAGKSNKKAQDVRNKGIKAAPTLAPSDLIDMTLGRATSVWTVPPKDPLTAPSFSFDRCEQLASERGMQHGQSGHLEFVQQCRKNPPSDVRYRSATQPHERGRT